MVLTVFADHVGRTWQGRAIHITEARIRVEESQHDIAQNKTAPVTYIL